jgi:plasmid stabilization system protein ParE
MPRGDKSAYTDKQKRKAEHIEEGYRERGMSEDRAEEIAWATVNKESGGGNKSGSGRGVPDTNVSAKRGGKLGGPGRGAPHSRPALGFGEEGRRHAQTQPEGEDRRLTLFLWLGPPPKDREKTAATGLGAPLTSSPASS